MSGALVVAYFRDANDEVLFSLYWKQALTVMTCSADKSDSRSELP